MQVLRRELAARGIPQAERIVHVQELPSYEGMILCNSRGWAPVGRVDETLIPQNFEFTDAVSAAYEECPRDQI
jgi:hypothetical protein